MASRITVDTSPQAVDWTFKRGDTWMFSFTLCVATTASPVTGEPADLSGSSWLFQVREGGPDGALFTTVAVVTGGQSSGLITGTVDEAVTATANVGKKAYYYDVQQSLGADVITPIEGVITVTADVSDSVKP